MGYLCYIKQFDFIISLYATEHVLSNTLSLWTMLRGNSVDLLEAAQEAVVVINIIVRLREAIRRFVRKCTSGGNRLQLSLTLSHACQEQLEGSNRGWMSQPQTQSPTGKLRAVVPSYWSSHSRKERQALITGGSSLSRPVSSPNKSTRIKQRRPR